LLWNFWKILWGGHNSTRAKAMGLIFCCLTFNITSAQEVTFEMLLHIQSILYELTSAFLCVLFIFVHHKSLDFVVGMWWLPEIVCNFHSGYFDCRGSFQTVVDSYCGITGWTWTIFFSDNNWCNWGMRCYCFDVVIAVYVGLPVIIIVSKTWTNNYTRNFQLE